MKSIARILAFFIIAGIAVYIITRPDPVANVPAQTPTATVPPAVTPAANPDASAPVGPDGWKRYDNASFAFSIRYPKDYSVDDAYRYTALGPEKDIPGIAFTVPAALTQGTNLSADTRLSVERLQAAESACKATVFLSAAQNERSETVNGRLYGIADSRDAGAGNFYEETVYATAANGYCYGLRLFIHSTNIGNYDPGTVREFDRQTLLDTYTKFYSSFALGL